jgi:60S ribosome subunit biogenesis protein NIP7
MSFLYGNHVLKAGVGRVTDGVQQHCGVVVVNMADVLLSNHALRNLIRF